MGWTPGLFPFLFWVLFAFNVQTAIQTIALVSGVDGAAESEWEKLALEFFSRS